MAENIVTTDHDDASETSADLEPEWLARLLTLAPEFAEADRDLLAYWDEPPCRDPTWEPLDEDTAQRRRRPGLPPRTRLSQRVATIAHTIVRTWDQFDEDIRHRTFDCVEHVLCTAKETGDEESRFQMKMFLLDNVQNMAGAEREDMLREMWPYLGPESKKDCLELDRAQGIGKVPEWKLRSPQPQRTAMGMKATMSAEHCRTPGTSAGSDSSAKSAGSRGVGRRCGKRGM
ncbi:hypothetical protein [Amycolatopsis rubida]|uniref:hypothetical protein n=1 Tax=Amycolatopsis rubida TaxID=112413 RepID=UPI00116079EE|nr:hypothetical protein [Amycolatopsis rubida]